MTSPTLRDDGSFDIPVTEAHVGAGLLDSLSSGMYPDVYDILREYIQNAIDAHATTVRVSVSKHEVTILDNGEGMGLEDLDNARKVGVSGKPGTGKIGFRGIGVYSSFAVCDQVEIVTRPKGGAEAFRLVFDHAAIRAETERVSGGRRNTPPLSATLDRHTRIFPADTKSMPKDAGDGSFTYIRLLRPTQHFRTRLNDEEKVRRYLTSRVPLDFPEFEMDSAGTPKPHTGFAHAAEVRAELKAWVPSLNLVKVHYRFGSGHEQLFTQPPVDDVLRPVFRVIQTKAGVRLAFLWACVSRPRNQLSPEEARGFQIRFRGFGIGNRRFPKVFWPSRGGGQLYEWVTGEIYVLDETLVPTVDRANFEEGDNRDRLFDHLKEVFDEFEKVVGRRREALRSLERVTADLRSDDQATRKKGQKELKKSIGSLDKLREDFARDPQLSVAELLDEEGIQILDALGILDQVNDPSQIDFSDVSRPAIEKSTGGSEPEKVAEPGSQTGSDTQGHEHGTDDASDEDETGTGDADGGSSDGSGTGHGASADDDPEPPSIVETLLGLRDWPLGAEAIFRELEGALRSAFSEAEFRTARRVVHERFTDAEDVLDDRD
ncbi:ATP-binding protein [Longimicrobium sp.]|jgi:hypothetical protein|uniref:ATP-binding protein n=1 Tax=Longimicrobium sp. TaxID=2029185 RepID=UPI002EDB18AE